MLFFNGRVEMLGFSVYLDMTPSNKFKYFVKISFFSLQGYFNPSLKSFIWNKHCKTAFLDRDINYM